jgi:hypothetical protein
MTPAERIAQILAPYVEKLRPLAETHRIDRAAALVADDEELLRLVAKGEVDLRRIVERLLRPSTSKSRGRPLGEKAVAIRGAIEDLASEYDVMTVRQVFYALTVRGTVPKDEKAGYRPVQTQVLRMRREGSLPWTFIADGTRWLRKPETFDSVTDALAAVKRAYRRNLWRSQDIRVEVWLEKDALAGVVREATEPWDVALMVSRGTSSATFLHAAAEAATEAWELGNIETVVLALYDFDAAGRRCARTVERGFAEYAPGSRFTSSFSR